MMIIWLLLQIFVFASFAIPSDSMEPVLIPGDYVLVNKMLKGPRDVYKRQEYSNENLFVSRVLQCVPLFGTINFIWWNK